MKFISPNAALVVALVAVSAVAGTALALPGTGDPAAPAAAEMLVAPSPAADSVASDDVVLASQPSLWVPIAPYRAWDSRNNPGFRLFSVDEGNGALALNVLFDEDDNLVIPQNATGVTFNVTVVGQRGVGFLTIAEVNQPTSEAKKTSTVNWSGQGSAIANGSSVALGEFEGDGPGYIKVLVGGTASGTDYIVDITGYYRAATPG